jgi:DNA-binding NarL/FixJ family response regulator
VRVIVADDSGLFRDLLGQLLQGHGHRVVAQAASATELATAVDSVPCDLVLTDIRMPPTHTDDGLRASLSLHGRHPGVGVILLSQHGELEYAEQLIQAIPRGVGYLLKERATSARELLDAIDRVAAGAVVFDPDLVTRLIARPRADNPLHELTPRETEVLALMAEGLGNHAIAKRLRLSRSTVEKHASAIFRKLRLDVEDAGDNARVRAVLSYLRHSRNPLSR